MELAKVIDLNQYGLQDEARTRVNYFDAVVKFQDAIQSAGFGRPDEILQDGRIHRFQTSDDKAGKKSGWYVFYPDGGPCPAGAFGSWKDDSHQTWSAKANYELSRDDNELIRERFERAKAEREAHKKQAQAQAASRLWELFVGLPEATSENCPYLAKKKVGAFGYVKSLKGTLCIPLWDHERTFVGLQFVSSDRKVFGRDVSPKGNFNVLEGDDSTVYICEGYATGASIHMSTGQTAVVAFNAGNLIHAAKAIKELYPNSKLVVAADDDRWTKKNGAPYNPGLEAAKKTANELGIKYVSPFFKDLSTQPTDFNDLHVLEGPDEIRRQLQPTNFSVITFTDVMAMEFEDRPVVDGLLDENENLVIIGPSNIGKSLFTFSMAAMIARPQMATGKIDLNEPPMLFGMFPVRQPRRVLFLQSENTAKSTKKRLSMVVKDRPDIAESFNSMVMPSMSGDCRVHGHINGDFFDTAVAMIRRSQAEVVIVDPLVSFHDADENDNVAMRAALDRFSDLAQTANVSLVIVHHTGKDAAKGPRGASSIRDWYDNALIISPSFASDSRFVLRVVHDKSRNYKIQKPFFIERTKNLDFIPAQDPEIYIVAQAIQNSGGLVQSEAALIEAIEPLDSNDMSRSYWQKVIKRACREKVVTKHGTNKNISYTVAESD